MDTVKAEEITVPPAIDGSSSENSKVAAPVIEWWDEAFLPKERREALKRSRANSKNMKFLRNASTSDEALVISVDDITLLSLRACRTYNLVQHPVPIRPLGAAAQSNEPVVLPMFLTKVEQKKLRRATRREREMEKRDKVMMGLIPPPEPKFKVLYNYAISIMVAIL